MFIDTLAGHQRSAGRPGRTDFVEFRNRLKRLVESLVALRELPPSGHPWAGEQERVEVKLEAGEPPLPRKEDYLSALANFQ